MQKWEYLEVVTVYGTVSDRRIIPSKGKALFSNKGDSVPEFVDYIDALGREGWEMVNTQERDVGISNQVTYYLKRPLD
jgi:hypothetical protein